LPYRGFRSPDLERIMLVILEPSWARLGALLGNLGAILRPQNRSPLRAKRQRGTNHLFSLGVGRILASVGHPREAPWPLGVVLDGPVGLSEHVGSHLERSCTILFHLGGHVVISWAIFSETRPSDTSRNTPGHDLLTPLFDAPLLAAPSSVSNGNINNDFGSSDPHSIQRGGRGGKPRGHRDTWGAGEAGDPGIARTCGAWRMQRGRRVGGPLS